MTAASGPCMLASPGWVDVELSRVNDKQLGAVIREAFRLTTAKRLHQIAQNPPNLPAQVRHLGAHERRD